MTLDDVSIFKKLQVSYSIKGPFGKALTHKFNSRSWI